MTKFIIVGCKALMHEHSVAKRLGPAYPSAPWPEGHHFVTLSRWCNENLGRGTWQEDNGYFHFIDDEKCTWFKLKWVTDDEI